MRAIYLVLDHAIFRFPDDAFGSPGNHAHLHRRQHAQNCKGNPLLSQYLNHAVAIKNALFWSIKISEFGKWVERHNGDHVIHMTSDDITADRKGAQPSRVRACDGKRRIGNTWWVKA